MCRAADHGSRPSEAADSSAAASSEGELAGARGGVEMRPFNTNESLSGPLFIVVLGGNEWV